MLLFDNAKKKKINNEKRSNIKAPKRSVKKLVKFSYFCNQVVSIVLSMAKTFVMS